MIFVAIPLFTYILVSAISPIYQSQGKLFIRSTTSQNRFVKSLPDEIGKFDFDSSEYAMGTMEETIESFPVIGKVIEELHLKDKDGEPYQLSSFVNPGRIRLLMQKKGIAVKQVVDSYAFTISGYSDDQLEAKLIAEKAMQNFVDHLSGIFRKNAQEAVYILESRCNTLLDELKTANNKLAEYKAAHGIYALSTQVDSLLSEISTLESEKNKLSRTAEQNRRAIESIKSASLIKQSGFKKAAAAVEDSSAVQEMKNSLAKLETQVMAISLEKTENHPELKTLRSQVEAMKKALRKEISKTFEAQLLDRTAFYENLAKEYSSATISYVMSMAAEHLISQHIAEKQNRLETWPERQRAAAELERQVGYLDTTYKALLMDLELARIAERTTMSNAMVIQPPVLAEDKNSNLYFPPPRKGGPLVLASIFGLSLGLIGALIADYLDDTIHPEDESGFPARLAGTVPYLPGKTLDQIENVGPEIMSQINDILVNFGMHVMSCSPSAPNVYLFMSPGSGEGKSLVSSLLGSELARHGEKVLMVDCNLRSPALHRIFKVPNSEGLSNHERRPDNCVVSSSLPNLDIIPAGPPRMEDPQWLLVSDFFCDLMKSLAPRYDAIILDAAGLDRGSDALVLCRHASVPVCVVSQGSTSRAALQSFLDTFKNVMPGSQPLIVLNKVKKV